ncbi:hypothetical protein OEZ86_001523 [Tetradesmus obliquus]|nr:hypothetical protein OEZ86_001523 [Tetradesmus obliquus]
MAASWLSMMQHQAACDPLAGCLVGLQQGTDEVELLLMRSSSPDVDQTGRLMLDSTRLFCSGVRGDGALRGRDLCDLLPPPKDSSQGAADCISLATWQAAAQQLQQQVPQLLGTKQQVARTMHFKQQLISYRAALRVKIAAANAAANADNAAGLGQRVGIRAESAGDPRLIGELKSYRRLFRSMKEFLQASGVLQEQEMVTRPGTSTAVLLLRQPPSLQQQQQQQQQQ